MSKVTAHPHANLVQYYHALLALLDFAVNVYQVHIYILVFAHLVFRAAELVPRNQLVKCAMRDSTYRQTKRRVFPALRTVNNALLRMLA